MSRRKSSLAFIDLPFANEFFQTTIYKERTVNFFRQRPILIATATLLVLSVSSGAAHAAVEVLVTSAVSGDQAAATCMAREVNLANGLTVPVRRGGKNTIRLQESGISARLIAAALANCTSCVATIRRSGDTARIDVDIPATTTVGSGPNVTLKLTGRPDTLVKLEINPGYSISTNMMPQVGTVRKGDTVTLAGRDLDAGSIKVDPACVVLAGRSATSMQLKYNCEVQPGFQGTMATVKMFNNVATAQRCEVSQDWRIANFSANGKPDLTPVLDTFGSKPFRPVTPGSNNVEASFCRNLPPAESVCDRVFNSTDGTVRDSNCRAGIAQGFVPIPALSFSIKNIGDAPSAPTVTKVFDGAGRELVSENTLAVTNGQFASVRVRAAKSVRVTASGPTGCQLDVVGLTSSPFDADAYVVKADTGNALTEGGAGRANNEARF